MSKPNLVPTPAIFFPADSLLANYEAACRFLAESSRVTDILIMCAEAEAWRAAARIAKNRELEINAAIIRLTAERHVGRLIDEQRQGNGLAKGAREKGTTRGMTRGIDAPASLADAGIDKDLAKRARKLWAMPEAEFAHRISVWREDAVMGRVALLDVIAGKVRGTQGTGENEWYTPDEYLALAREVLGDFDLDPASSAQAQRRVKAKQFFTLDDDGLAQDWHGRVWMNPPYAQPFIEQFAKKLVADITVGRVTQAIALTHNYTDTHWWHHLARPCAAFCFPEGRIRFIGRDGKLAAPTQGQTFFYFGSRPDRFRAAFADVGIVLDGPP